VLTYYYDGLSESKSGTQEDYTPEAGHDQKRFAAYHDQIKKVVIDESLQRFQPTTLANMFDGGSGNELSALDTIEGLEYIDFSEVTDMYAMFAGCSSLKDINLSTFNTDKVTNMAFLFYKCAALTNLNVTGFSTANVTDMRRMFYGCSAITELDLDNFKTDKVEKAFNMFDGCSALETIYCSGNWSAINEGHEMFNGCTALVGGNGTHCDGITNVNCAYAHLDETGNPGYFTKKSATGMEQTNEEMKKCRNEKILRDGQLLILRDGKMYNAQGAEVK
jgi:surface protein